MLLLSAIHFQVAAKQGPFDNDFSSGLGGGLYRKQEHFLFQLHLEKNEIESLAW